MLLMKNMLVNLINRSPSGGLSNVICQHSGNLSIDRCPERFYGQQLIIID